MNNLIIKNTPIENLKTIKHQSSKDERGFLIRLFCQKTLSHLIKGKIICQINKTLTLKKGAIRGLHFQYPPYAETKIISCLKGKVWDVALDLRLGSPTFLRYHSEILTEGDCKSYIIPEGFAHGFQTLTSDCEMLYLHTADYNKNFEETINVVDPKIGINWPLQISEISDRDRNCPMLSDDFKGIDL